MCAKLFSIRRHDYCTHTAALREVGIMPRLQTQIIARRDADGFFLPAERVYEDLPVEENGLTEAENANIEWLAGLLLPMYLEYRQKMGKTI